MAQTSSGLKLVTTHNNQQAEHSSGRKLSQKGSNVSISDLPVNLSFEDIERMNEDQAKQMRRKQLSMLKLPRIKGVKSIKEPTSTQQSFLRIVDERASAEGRDSNIMFEEPMIIQKFQKDKINCLLRKTILAKSEF